MAWFSKSLGLTTECSMCGSQQGLVQCPHCEKILCEVCLQPLVNRNGWPEWMRGRKVSSLKDLKGHISQYMHKLRAKGGNAHVCTEFVNYRWSVIYKALLKTDPQEDGTRELVLH